jgi:serine/threonine protein kinase
MKAVGYYLSRGRKIGEVCDSDEDKMIIGKSKHYTVYLCEWRGLLVAVKRLDFQLTDETTFSKLTQHLKDEIGILVKMHHPNIVQILGITLDPFQIILEYFPMRDLNYFQVHHRSLFSCWKFSAYSYQTKKRWTIDLLLALIYLHERRPESVIHRDLKPSNVLITNDGSLKITDFGLSKLHADYYELINSSDQNLDCLVESHNLKFDTFDIGTYWYMSPELRNRIPYDNKMDIWSLGLILYEIWEQRRTCTAVLSPLHFIEYNSTRHKWLIFTMRTPKAVREIIIQCLDIDPNNRPSVRKILTTICAMPDRFLWF